MIMTNHTVLSVLWTVEVQSSEQACGGFSSAFDNQLLRHLINEYLCEVVLERSLVLLWSL